MACLDALLVRNSQDPGCCLLIGSALLGFLYRSGLCCLPVQFLILV